MTKEAIASLPDTVKAAYICGLYAGLVVNVTHRDREGMAHRLKPFAQTAGQVAFEGGKVDSLAFGDMLAKFGRLLLDG